MCDRDAPISFKCRVCGVECPVAPDPPATAVCEEHCEFHEYEHDPWRRNQFCKHCDKQAPDDFYDEFW